MNFFEANIDVCYIAAKQYRNTKSLSIIDTLGTTIINMHTNPYQMNLVEKSTFFDQYKSQLYFIAQTLRLVHTEERRYRVSVNKMRPAFFIDNLMEQTFMYNTFMTRLLDFISVMMREFMKGITYFARDAADEHRDKPIYHRDVSCGSRQALHELDCTGFHHNPREFLRRSLKNRKCTIERQIYDQLFQRYFPSHEQNYGHRMMLSMSSREEFFNKCYPGTTIEVSVIFNSDSVPIKMSICQCSSVKILVEKYEKTCNMYNANLLNWNDISNLDITHVSNIYTNDVVGKRLVYELESSMKIYTQKQQSFTHPIDAWTSEDVESMTAANTFSNNAAKRQLNTRR